MLTVCNLTPVVRLGYRVGVPVAGQYRECINTDSQYYGGSNVGNSLGVVSAEEIAAAVVAAIVESGAASAKDMGKVMNALRPKLAGRADMGAVSAQVKAKLGS